MPGRHRRRVPPGESFQSSARRGGRRIRGCGPSTRGCGVNGYSDELGDIKVVERPADGSRWWAPLVQKALTWRPRSSPSCAHHDAVVQGRHCPARMLFANLWDPERSRDAYPRFDDFMADVVGCSCDEVRELLRLGCG